MKIFVNGNNNLGIVAGSVVYEFSTGAEKARLIGACRAFKSGEFDRLTPSEQQLKSAIDILLGIACNGAKSIGNRIELEAKNDPRIMIGASMPPRNSVMWHYPQQS